MSLGKSWERDCGRTERAMTCSRWVRADVSSPDQNKATPSTLCARER